MKQAVFDKKLEAVSSLVELRSLRSEVQDSLSFSADRLIAIRQEQDALEAELEELDFLCGIGQASSFYDHQLGLRALELIDPELADAVRAD